MYPRPSHSRHLKNRNDKTCARLAEMATNDVVWGGAAAMVKAKQLAKDGNPIPGDEIVSDVYSRSTGKTSVDWGAWECGECGQTYLGRSAANKCCQEEP